MQLHIIRRKNTVCEDTPGEAVSALVDHAGPRDMDHMEPKPSGHLQLLKAQDKLEEGLAI
jgi:hypothetical protein